MPCVSGANNVNCDDFERFEEGGSAEYGVVGGKRGTETFGYNTGDAVG